jgi:hypothetical protein
MYSRVRIPKSGALLIIEPPCRARWRHAAPVGMNTMSSSPLSVSLHSFGVISSTGAKWTEAALEDVEPTISTYRIIDPLLRNLWLRQIRHYTELHLGAFALRQLSCYLNSVRISVAADDCRTAACEQQRGRSSLTTARSADRHDLARKSSGYRTLGRTPVRNTHRDLSRHITIVGSNRALLQRVRRGQNVDRG